MSRRFSIVVSLVAIAAAWVAFTFGSTLNYWYHIRTDPIEFLHACFYDAPPTPCLKRGVEALVAERGVRESLETVAASFTPSQCHNIGHLIGREAYTRAASLDAALTACDGTCSSSCIHGAIGGAFSSIPSVATAITDVAHIDSATLRAEGKQFCRDWETCHGVGHVAFQVFNGLEDALRFCESIASGEERSSCDWGVFMENNSPTPSGVSSEASDVRKVRDGRDLLSPCTTVAEEYKYSCFHFLYISQDVTFAERGITSEATKHALRMEACGLISSSHERMACYEGVGLAMYSRNVGAENAYATCRSLRVSSEYAACLFGFEHARSDWNDDESTLAQCARETDSTGKRACYEAAFESVRIRKWRPVPDACNAASKREECESYLDAYIKDPHALVFSYVDPRSGLTR